MDRNLLPTYLRMLALLLLPSNVDMNTAELSCRLEGELQLGKNGLITPGMAVCLHQS
jgi:hypothetical protein